jgi:F-type H+-transporting ATPase subunit gamma
MGDTTASLRRKIISAGDLQSVVRTMKALAASNIGQYETSVRALADYDRTVQLGLAVCLRDSYPMPSFATRNDQSSARAVGVVVFGSDQGLVGQFNQMIVERSLEVIAVLPGSPLIWAVGERVRSRLQDAGVPLAGFFALPGSVEAIAPLIGQILLETEARPGSAGEIAELHLVFNRRTIGSAYEPISQRLLPLDDEWRHTFADLGWPTGNLPEIMGSRTTTIRALIREYVFVSLFRACAESLASENASRLAAMERADRNINELLENLHSAFNRLRQSDIDEELFDVISGYEALSQPRLSARAHQSNKIDIE